MNPNLKPTPLEKLRHKKGWRLIRVKQELDKRQTPISYPTLLRIEHGYRTMIVRDDKGAIVNEKKIPYKPRHWHLIQLAKLFNVKNPQKIYENRHK